MNFLQYFKEKKIFKEQKSQIDAWLKEMKIKDYVINNDLTVDVDGDVNLSSKNLTEIPIQFGSVKNFFIINNKLTSLVGSPFEVDGYFYCQNNQLTTLKGAPQVVNGTFNCSHNKLTNLKGSPREVDGIFDCSYNLLTNLEGGPESVLSAYNCNNNQINTLKSTSFISLGENFNCANNQLANLEGVPSVIEGSLDCSNNNISSLDFLPHVVKEDFDLSYNPLYLKNLLTSPIIRCFSNNNNTKLAKRFIFTCKDVSITYDKYYEEMRQFASKDKFIVDNSAYDHFYVVLTSIMMMEKNQDVKVGSKEELVPTQDFVLYTDYNNISQVGT
jgi:hypothetical protein